MNFGDTITVTQVYHRRTRYRHNSRTMYDDTLKVWEPWTIKPRPAIYLGLRTLSNGVREWEDEVGAIFHPETHIKAALVCFSTRENPVYVPIESLEARP